MIYIDFLAVTEIDLFIEHDILQLLLGQLTGVGLVHNQRQFQRLSPGYAA